MDTSRYYPTLSRILASNPYPTLERLTAADATDWRWKDEVLSKGKAGDILQVTNDKGSAYVVMLPESDGSGFYYYPSNEKGELETDRKRGIVHHSNMFFKEEMKIVGHRDAVKEHQYKEYKWYETGYETVDAELANLDDRYQLFSKYAPENLKTLYAEQEDRNFHQENAEMVKEFAEHLASGGSPGAFSAEPSADF